VLECFGAQWHREVDVRRVVLASESPRRAELLRQMGLSFEVQPSSVDESLVNGSSPAEFVREAAMRKATHVAHLVDDAIVIGADTVVVLDEHLLGKPTDAAHAASMIRMLRGRSHSVVTGIAVVEANGGTLGRSVSDHVETVVHFRPLTEREVEAYVASGEPMGKAGAYAIQGLGSMLIEGIEGDYFNVVGLPVCRLAQVLARFGVHPLEAASGVRVR